MTLIEALQTGYPFKRLGDASWFSDFSGGSLILELTHDYVSLTKGTLLASDWEVRETQVCLTKSGFQKAGALATKRFLERRGGGLDCFLADFAEVLGFSERGVKVEG